MKLSETFPKCIAVALALAVTMVAGCVSTVKPFTGLRTERTSAGGVQVLSIQLKNTGCGLRVSGTVGRAVGHGGSPRRHLDVETVGADGAVLQRAAVMFHPNPVRHSPRSRTRSAYAVTMPQVPPPGGAVRVVVHACSLSDCRN